MSKATMLFPLQGIFVYTLMANLSFTKYASQHQVYSSGATVAVVSKSTPLAAGF